MKQFIELTSPDGDHKYLARVGSITVLELETDTSHAIIRNGNHAIVINSESAARLAELLAKLEETR